MNRLIVLLLLCVCLPLHAADDDVAMFTSGARILFQGDSITDGNRGRNADPNHILGHGYVFIIAAIDLQKRWAADAIELKPDVLSVLIGINDEGHGVPLEQYEPAYDALLTQAK